MTGCAPRVGGEHTKFEDLFLLAAGYRARYEDELGWEYEVYWELIDLITGEVLDRWRYGTVGLNDVVNIFSDAGNRKKSETDIARELEQRQRGEKILRDLQPYSL
jgi:hypothetical protein